jgi:hypothetical protein
MKTPAYELLELPKLNIFKTYTSPFFEITSFRKHEMRCAGAVFAHLNPVRACNFSKTAQLSAEASFLQFA